MVVLERGTVQLQNAYRVYGGTMDQTPLCKL